VGLSGEKVHGKAVILLSPSLSREGPTNPRQLTKKLTEIVRSSLIQANSPSPAQTYVEILVITLPRVV
jgi:hypothetical protein